MTILPSVGRIQGATPEQQPTHEASVVKLQYTDRKQEWCELEMPFLDAMYLLNILRGIEADAGFLALNKPPN